MTSRRRVLSILAGAAALPLLPGIASADNEAEISEWRGVALGADARIILDHPNAKVLLQQAVAEVLRLEAIFSLFQRQSQLSQLNQTGVLANPSFELVELLSICGALNARTQGAFDPTVQPLWALYAESYSIGRPPRDAEIKAAQKSVGWQYVALTPAKITLTRPGMALTLNGIAQGYIADKIATLFKAAGVENVMINTGEILALGHAPGAQTWPVTIKDQKLPWYLNNDAIATSAPLGTVFDRAGKIGHIIDPRSGRPGGRWQQVSVITKSAAIADGLSTGFSLMDRAAIAQAKSHARVVLRKWPNVV